MIYVELPTGYTPNTSQVRVRNLTTKEKIINEVCIFFSTSLEKLQQRTRRREVCYPRQVVLYFLRRNTSLSLKNIGQIFAMDHTTVIHSYQIIEDLMFSDPQIKSDIDFLTRRI